MILTVERGDSVKEHIALGILDGRMQYLYKHDWACGWSWAFGSIGNRLEHQHFKSLFLNNTKYLSETLQSPNFSDTDFWVLRDFYKQAYALQAAAEVYQYAGHQTTEKNLVGFLKSDEMAATLNAHLKTVLDTAWDFATDPVDFRRRWESVTVTQTGT